MKGFMYILKCADGSYYTGSTIDLERRLWQHQNGEGANFTKAHLPVELVYTEEFARIEDAYKREKQIQKWTRKKKEALIKGDFDTLHKLAAGSTSLTDRGSTSRMPSLPKHTDRGSTSLTDRGSTSRMLSLPKHTDRSLSEVEGNMRR